MAGYAERLKASETTFIYYRIRHCSKKKKEKKEEAIEPCQPLFHSPSGGAIEYDDSREISDHPIQSSVIIMTINTAAALFIIMYYAAIISIGVWAGRKFHIGHQHELRRMSKISSRTQQEPVEAFLVRLFICNRRMPLHLGFTSLMGEPELLRLLGILRKHGIVCLNSLQFVLEG